MSKLIITAAGAGPAEAGMVLGPGSNNKMKG